MRVEADVDIEYVSIDNAIKSLRKAKKELLAQGCSPESIALYIGIEENPYGGGTHACVEVYGYNNKRK